MLSNLVEIWSMPFVNKSVKSLLSMEGGLYAPMIAHLRLFMVTSRAIVSMGRSSSKSGLRLAGRFERTYAIIPPPELFLSFLKAL